jgi:hypothetical protein
MLQMELRPTHPGTSIWQESPMEDWMVIPIRTTLTFSWLSTTPVEQSSGPSSLGHQVKIMIMEEAKF